ncbi:hypothetical protein C5D98_09480, partial [Rathayibacter rathayi]
MSAFPAAFFFAGAFLSVAVGGFFAAAFVGDDAEAFSGSAFSGSAFFGADSAAAQKPPTATLR